MKTVTETRQELLSIRAAIQDEWGDTLSEMKANPDVSREEIAYINRTRTQALIKINSRIHTLPV